MMFTRGLHRMYGTSTIRSCSLPKLSFSPQSSSSVIDGGYHHRRRLFSNSSPSMNPSQEDVVPTSSPIRIAIVGSGPSGCYTAKYLLQATTTTTTTTPKKVPIDTHIDIIERLPTAYGLVRNGVAPDHPEVKNVQHEFDTMIEKNNKDKIQFYGNVNVGEDISLQELRERYDMVVLCYGCESDRSLQHLIVGEKKNLRGIFSAREFVAWYNGHVDYDWVGPIVQESLSSGIQNIVVVGHGNVALDCARILAKTREELIPTDLTTRALNILHPPTNNDASTSTNPIQRNVSVVGRRGHIQGAFTIKELRELTKLPQTKFIVRQDELEMGKSTAASQEELEKNRPRTRIDTLLTEAAAATGGSGQNNRQVELRFLLNPIRFEANPDNPTELGSVICERTKLMGDVGRQEAIGTGEEEILPAQLALISIGYKGVAIQGIESSWFDESRGILKNQHGLVTPATAELGGLYTAGWLKRGPSGIIGTNIPDAKDTVATMLHDIAQKRIPLKDSSSTSSSSSSSLKDLLDERGIQYVDWEAYQRIDQEEMNPDRKRHPDQPREKITISEDLLKIARSEK